MIETRLKHESQPENQEGPMGFLQNVGREVRQLGSDMDR